MPHGAGERYNKRSTTNDLEWKAPVNQHAATVILSLATFPSLVCLLLAVRTCKA